MSPFLTLLVVVTVLLQACQTKEPEVEKSIDEEVLDPNSSLNTNFDGKIFSIPSPVQTSMLIKEANLPFMGGLLNPPENADSYTSEVRRALNLGIYGTDMGYATLYNQNALSLKYLNAIEKITTELGLEGAFDKSFMDRLEKNSSDQDSMIRIVSDAFRKADNFLKNNDRKNTSVLILTGGWIESLYFACQLNRTSSNEQILSRIGEQQQTLTTIIEILDLYNKDGINDEILSDLEDLKLTFNMVRVNYTYLAPETNEAKKLTTFRHKTKIRIDTNVLNMITLKINNLRSKIVE
ncbi:MAG: hypothetical protein EP338_12900 [Bacteroidetes bacterium]|nr:MAG: hypothetical protein EP338_12900 [Bacteroidota bacterium]